MEAARPARLADLDAIGEVAEATAAELGPGRGGALLLALEAEAGPLRHRMEAAIAGTAGRLGVVGTYDEVVLGFGLGVVHPLADGRQLGVIEILAVDPAARAVGIGEAMMDHLVAAFRSQGCIGVDCRALPGDRETKNFFESFGLKARLLTVHLSFGAEQVPVPGRSADES